MCDAGITDVMLGLTHSAMVGLQVPHSGVRATRPGQVAWKEYKEQKEGYCCCLLPLLSSRCREMFLLCDASLPYYPALDPVDYGLKSLQTVSQHKIFLL